MLAVDVNMCFVFCIAFYRHFYCVVKQYGEIHKINQVKLFRSSNALSNHLIGHQVVAQAGEPQLKNAELREDAQWP